MQQAFEQNKALIRRLVEEVWNAGDETAIERYFHPGLREAVTSHWRELLAAFSDVQVTIEALIAEGDLVAARLMVSGTHDRGAFAGQPPSGRRLSWGSFRFYRIDEGRVAETWAMQDRLSLLQQLGVVPPLESDVHWANGAAR